MSRAYQAYRAAGGRAPKGLFRRHYGPEKPRSRIEGPNPSSTDYAAYLTAMRGINGRLEKGRGDCCYSLCLPRDEWRNGGDRIGEDFAGEFAKASWH